MRIERVQPLGLPARLIGSRTKLRLLVPPRERIEAYPRTTLNPSAGLPVRAGLNRSLDAIHPKLPHVADDVLRPRTAPAPTRTQFGWVPPSSPIGSRPNTTAMLMRSGHPRPKVRLDSERLQKFHVLSSAVSLASDHSNSRGLVLSNTALDAFSPI